MGKTYRRDSEYGFIGKKKDKKQKPKNKKNSDKEKNKKFESLDEIDNAY
jgi:hypothetical protein